MADNEEFLKKVYDKYLGSDYEWGDADLNPKREIRKSDEEQWEEEQAAILEAIENRLKELQAQAAKLPKYKKPEVVDNDDFKVNISGMNGGPSPSDDTSMEQLAMQAALGGDIGDNLFIPQGNFDDQINFMLNTIIPQLIPVLVQGPFYPDTTPGGPGLSVEMFNPGCDTEDETADDFVSSNPEFNKLKKELEDELDDRGDDEEDDNGNAGGSGGAADQADKDAEKADAAAEKAIAARNKDVAECIAKELGILQAILAILKVINMLKKILLLIMSILVPLVKMIAFAAQCWINPPAAGEVIQMVAEKISALLISAIGEIIQMIWDLLDMDCKTEQVMKVLDEINEVLAGVDSAVNMTKNLISFGMKAYEENAASLKDSFDKFKDPANAQKWKEAIGGFADKEVWKEHGSDVIKESLFGDAPLDDPAAWKTLLGNAMPSGIKDALNSVIDSAKGILNTAKDLVDDTGLQDSVLKATLVDMTDFLGPISIK